MEKAIELLQVQLKELKKRRCSNVYMCDLEAKIDELHKLERVYIDSIAQNKLSIRELQGAYKPNTDDAGTPPVKFQLANPIEHAILNLIRDNESRVNTEINAHPELATENPDTFACGKVNTLLLMNEDLYVAIEG